MVLVGFLAPGVRSQARRGYPGDSFWTLDMMGRVSVITISMVAITLFFWLLATKTNHVQRRWPGSPGMGVLDGVAGLVLFSVGHSLLPQVYYALYQLLIPGLPTQIVVRGVPDLDRLRSVAALAHGGSLSDHLSGVVFWTVVPFTALLWVRKRH